MRVGVDAKPVVLLLRSANRNFPVDLGPELAGAGYRVESLGTLQEFIACPARHEPQLVLLEIGSLAEVDRAVVAVDWTEHVQPFAPARFVLLLASKNLSLGEKSAKLASAEVIVLPVPTRNLLFKLELQGRLLRKPAPTDAPRAEGFSAKLEEVVGPSGRRVLVVRGREPKEGAWNHNGMTPSGKVRWRWVNAPGTREPVLPSSFSWTAESESAPRFDEEKRAWLLEGEGDRLACQVGEETVYAAAAEFSSREDTGESEGRSEPFVPPGGEAQSRGTNSATSPDSRIAADRKSGAGAVAERARAPAPVSSFVPEPRAVPAENAPTPREEQSRAGSPGSSRTPQPPAKRPAASDAREPVAGTERPVNPTFTGEKAPKPGGKSPSAPGDAPPSDRDESPVNSSGASARAEVPWGARDSTSTSRGGVRPRSATDGAPDAAADRAKKISGVPESPEEEPPGASAPGAETPAEEPPKENLGVAEAVPPWALRPGEVPLPEASAKAAASLTAAPVAPLADRPAPTSLPSLGAPVPSLDDTAPLATESPRTETGPTKVHRDAPAPAPAAAPERRDRTVTEEATIPGKTVRSTDEPAAPSERRREEMG